jgi:hypothetical protein
MAKVTIKNTSDGPRGVHTNRGLRFLEPGESREVEISDAELKGAKSTGYFEVGGKAEKPEDDGLGELKVEDLRALAENDGINLGDATRKGDVIDAIRNARGQRG